MTDKFEKTEIAENLIMHRKNNKMTQSNVADYLKIKRSTYAYYERNIFPPQNVIKKLAALYNISIHELLYGLPDPVEEARNRSIDDHSGSILKLASGNDLMKIYLQGDNSSNFYTLTENEKKLIACFRLLPAPFREKILKEAEELSDKAD